MNANSPDPKMSHEAQIRGKKGDTGVHTVYKHLNRRHFEKRNSGVHLFLYNLFYAPCKLSNKDVHCHIYNQKEKAGQHSRTMLQHTGRVQVGRRAQVGVSPCSDSHLSVALAAEPVGHVCVVLCLKSTQSSQLVVNSRHKACLFGSQQHFVPRNISLVCGGEGRRGAHVKAGTHEL